MSMITNTIKTAMAYNRAHPEQSAADAEEKLAQAIIDTVKSLTITYTTGLISASPGSPVTGVLTTVVIS